ncbi:unnamed protein product [Bursaphelenchus okinawaensis]|uniref:Uncharacterized protein n=1 Tax=Bursaphelenchus okinawaensis TaxID=465554 RepID=A0A811KD47_9BILA|nr:unnamed protein product [Bursaphelenchus okinawaensis]CAG9100825.1 unnamed protein product [Bursaphelenchus okinawaensis]
MVATYFPALFPKIAALGLLSLSPDQELCVTYTQFTDSTNELEAVRYTQCKSTELTSGKPAGVFKKDSPKYKLLQLYPVNTALDSIVYSGLWIADDKDQLSGLWLLKVAPGEPKELKKYTDVKERQFGVGNGHVFYQDCQKTEVRKHFDMANAGEAVNMTHEGLTICGKPEFGLTNDGLVWTKPEGCWKLDGNDLKPSGCSDVAELVFTIEALVNMDPTISQDVDQSDLKTLLVLVHSQLAPQTTTTITTTPTDDTDSLDDTESEFSGNTTRPPYTGDLLDKVGWAVSWITIIVITFLTFVFGFYLTDCCKHLPRRLPLPDEYRKRHSSTSSNSSTSSYTGNSSGTSTPSGTNTPSGTSKDPVSKISNPSNSKSGTGKSRKSSGSSGTSTNSKKRGKSKKSTGKEDDTEFPGEYVAIEEFQVATPSGKHTRTETREHTIPRG